MNPKLRVKSFFSQCVSEWAAHYSDPEPRTLGSKNVRARQRFALKMVASAAPRGSKVLDVGCGTGEMAARLMELGYEVWGLDLSEAMIRHARGRCRSDRFRVGDIEHIPFADETFDAVVCLGVIEYLPTDEAALAEIWRVLKPGGSAVVSTPSAVSPLHHMDRILAGVGPRARAFYRLAVYRLRGRRSPVDHPSPLLTNRKYHPGSWLRLLRSSGFEPEEWICHGWGWYRSELGVLAGFLFHRAQSVHRVLARCLGRMALGEVGERFVRNRALNWLASEQIVRVRAIKSAAIRIAALWANLPDLLEVLAFVS